MNCSKYLLMIMLAIGLVSCSKDGPEGPIGPRGERGEKGEQGARGTDGTLLRYGNGAPSTSLGSEGDFYIDVANNNLYGPKTGNSWGSATNIQGDTGARGATGAAGAKGDTGARGATGAKGDKGDTGATGAKGADGSQFLSGTAVPTTQGKVGDFYFRTSTGMLYGPKTASGWGAGVSLKGDKGDKGDTGARGPQGERGATGATGAQGPQGEPGNANVAKYIFTVGKDDWAAGNYGFDNIHHYFDIPPSLIGGISLSSSRHVVLAYVTPTFSTGGYNQKKQTPYVYGIDDDYGIKFELSPGRQALFMSKTTNGWDNKLLPLAERPDEVRLEIIMIEIGIFGSLQGRLDLSDSDAVLRYFNLN